MRRLLPILLMIAAGACGRQEPPAEPERLSGRKLYERHGCALCHGPEGRGDGPVSSMLQPPARDLGDPAAYRIGPSEAEIASTLESGILVFGGSGMPAYSHIPAEDRQELARFIVGLQRPAPAPAE